MQTEEKELLLEHIRLHKICDIRAGGFCMTPLIYDRAKVTVSQNDSEELCDGDIVAYFIAEKLYIHRLIEHRGTSFFMKGDSAGSLLHEINKQDILGKVVKVRNPSFLRRLWHKVCNRLTSSNTNY